jgi:hypothetical protein
MNRSRFCGTPCQLRGFTKHGGQKRSRRATLLALTRPRPATTSGCAPPCRGRAAHEPICDPAVTCHATSRSRQLAADQHLPSTAARSSHRVACCGASCRIAVIGDCPRGPDSGVKRGGSRSAGRPCIAIRRIELRSTGAAPTAFERPTRKLYALLAVAHDRPPASEFFSISAYAHASLVGPDGPVALLSCTRRYFDASYRLSLCGTRCRRLPHRPASYCANWPALHQAVLASRRHFWAPPLFATWRRRPAPQRSLAAGGP